MKRNQPHSAATPAAPARTSDHVRTGLSPKVIASAFLDNLYYLLGRFQRVATRNDLYMALAYTVRDRLLQRWSRTAETYLEQKSRTVVYLSAEYLLGPQLGNNLLNLGILPQVREAMASLHIDLEELLAHEPEPGLGNGGLGRLAACYLDSMATLQIPSFGHGIRYEFGIFDQEIRDGWQVEVTDKWLRLGNPWEIARPEIAFEVKFGGHTEAGPDETGRHTVRWVPSQIVRGTAYDTPVLGYRVNTVNLLRLWKAEATESFNFQSFNTGDYYGAVQEKMVSENITKVLYPNDESPQGKRLRLQQQYFFAACAVQDLMRLYRQRESDLRGFSRKFAIQLNDTHPAVAVAELMRLLVDEHQLGWDEAWQVTESSFGYTNHTLLPEALEKWSVGLFGSTLPRHLEIVYEINRRFLEEIRLRSPEDGDRIARLSLIDEGGERSVRMANLACVGSHAINGVARLHSNLLKDGVLRDFHALTPAKFSNKTNGVTPRRFMALANPGLAALISHRLGDGWIRDLARLRELEPHANDPEFQAEWQRVKRSNKEVLTQLIQRRTGITVNPDSLFDAQMKRIHEYKRQHLNALHVVTLYNRLRRDAQARVPRRTCLFGGKAAPGYHQAKLIIKLINAIARVVNADPEINGRLHVVFLPGFSVKTAHYIYPAADLSEQISTAGLEASGTGNMKFAMNGALTIGTLDGANIEIREQVGPDNFFLFGHRVEEVQALQARGYRPGDCYDANPDLREALDQIASGFFCPENPGLFRSLVDILLHHDPFLVMADYASYVECQERVNQAYRDPAAWTHRAILNVARMGYFSSDRAIQEYCTDIWKVAPVPISLDL